MTDSRKGEYTLIVLVAAGSLAAAACLSWMVDPKNEFGPLAGLLAGACSGGFGLFTVSFLMGGAFIRDESQVKGTCVGGAVIGAIGGAMVSASSDPARQTVIGWTIGIWVAFALLHWLASFARR